MLSAHIISIGNELLIGDTVNTNASWISRFLTEKGIRVGEVRVIRDGYEEIRRAIGEALEQAALVITTGGLGPTRDDITKSAVASLFGTSLVMDEQVLEHNREQFKNRGLPFIDAIRDQALIPQGSEVLMNRLGTAPGLWLSRNGSWLAMLPGVPHEMRHLMETGVARKIEECLEGSEVRVVRYLRTAGVPESILSDEVIGDLDPWTGEGCEVAWLPGLLGVAIRITATGRTLEDAEARLAPLAARIYEKAGALIYGEGRDQHLLEVIGRILTERNLTLATAESCTGGLLANEITNNPGSSRYFRGGVVAYDNEVKTAQLGVSRETLREHGAVSRQVALEMAEGVARELNADIGLSTTGVAGPGGGTPEKPVGLVFIGIWTRERAFILEARLAEERLINKKRSVMIVAESLRRHLLGMDRFPYDLKPWTP